MSRTSVRSLSAWLAMLAVVMLSATELTAQQAGTIRGRVIEAATQRPLSGVQVVVEGAERGALTNANGAYIIVGVPAGPQTLRAQLIGYSSSEESVTVVGDQSAEVNFELSQSAIELDAIVVTGTAGGSQRRARRRSRAFWRWGSATWWDLPSRGRPTPACICTPDPRLASPLPRPSPHR